MGVEMQVTDQRVANQMKPGRARFLGRKNVVRKLLRIPYRRPDAGSRQALLCVDCEGFGCHWGSSD